MRDGQLELLDEDIALEGVRDSLETLAPDVLPRTGRAPVDSLAERFSAPLERQ